MAATSGSLFIYSVQAQVWPIQGQQEPRTAGFSVAGEGLGLAALGSTDCLTGPASSAALLTFAGDLCRSVVGRTR